MVDNEQISSMYRGFREIPLGKLQAPPPSVLKEMAEKGKIDLKGHDLNKVGQSLSMLVRLAHQTDAKEFEEAVKTGQFPPMKLSAEEMELVRGGLTITICVGIFAVGLAAGYWVNK